MDNLVRELINVLNQEAGVYEDVHSISKNKTRIIVEGKVNELENIIKLEQALVLQLGKLETMREQLIRKLSDKTGIRQEELTVSKIAGSIEPAAANELKNCQEKIVSTISGLKDANALNSRLIKNSLEYIEFSINLMANATAPTNNYGINGQVSDSKRKNFFDMKL